MKIYGSMMILVGYVSELATSTTGLVVVVVVVVVASPAVVVVAFLPGVFISSSTRGGLDAGGLLKLQNQNVHEKILFERLLLMVPFQSRAVNALL